MFSCAQEQAKVKDLEEESKRREEQIIGDLEAVTTDRSQEGDEAG